MPPSKQNSVTQRRRVARTSTAQSNFLMIIEGQIALKS
jgi:hypothetical protein